MQDYISKFYRNITAITEAINNLLTKSPEDLLAMRFNARDTALRYTWSAYKTRLKFLMESL